MARNSRWQRLPVLLLLLGAYAHAQKNLPTLSTATDSTQKGGKTTKSTRTSTSSTFALTDAPTLSTAAVGHLTGLPTLAGVGIPTIVVPYTANAPFMQKSSLPEGTFFIAVGAILAFFGLCVLLWRAIVACSINRNFRRSAPVSRGSRSEKMGPGSSYSGWSGSKKTGGYKPSSKSRFHRADGSSVSTEHLTGSSKAAQHYRDSTIDRSGAPPQDLFFSPTAQPRENHSPAPASRSPAYMPSGFYASPSSQPTSSTAGSKVSGSVPPYVHHHKHASTQVTQMSRPSPPISSGPVSRGAAAPRGGSRDETLHSRDHSRHSPTRDAFGAARSNPRGNHVYANPSTSSLMVAQSSVGSWSGPPTPHDDDVFGNGGYVRRERFR